MTRNSKAKIGIFGIGLAAYWPQFEGLKARLEKYQQDVEQHIIELGGEIVSAGLVDTALGAQQAGNLFARENVDLIICYVGTMPPRRRCFQQCSDAKPLC